MEHHVPNSQTHNDLPMVVHLLGDEELVEQFSVNADKAMEFLGIKRSRLTQISGRELRVGRVRQDRYLRPVYRVKDLEDYKSWTRSTATSQSSSKVMEKAISSIADQWNEFKLDSQHIFRASFSKLQRELLTELLNHKRSFELTGGRLQGDLSRGLALLGKNIGKLSEQLQDREKKGQRDAEKIHHELGILKSVSESMHLDMHRVRQWTKSYEDKQRDIHDSVAQFREALQLNVREMEQGITDLKLQLEKIDRDQDERFRELEKTEEKMSSPQLDRKVNPRLRNRFVKQKRRP